MSNEFARYSCQVNLPGFGEAAQKKLQHAKVLIAGMGGLGCPVAQYLASAGVGIIGFADYDVISASNLHRQILFNEEEIGEKKTVIAKLRLMQQNPRVHINIHDIHISPDNVMDLVSYYDIVVDCADNFDTKYLLNDACVLNNKPLVFGAIYQYEGQVAVFNAQNNDGTRGTNYRDIFPDVNAAQIPNCADGGVIPTLAGIIGCVQANEVIKYVTGTGELLSGSMLIMDALTMQSRIIKTGKTTKTNISTLAGHVIVPIITIQDLRLRLERDSIQLIDVRTEEEHLDHSIGGINIPLNDLGAILATLSFDKPTVFYCATGKRSAEAVKLVLGSNPNAKVMSLRNGIGTRHVPQG